jgi:2-polyprenyl-3-methyl-5-hydroxy-6-metoxy-1,4-benzoquinol methylase
MSSPERLYITDYIGNDDNFHRHIARYKFASMFSRGHILDCACGSGYGSKILSNNCLSVLGVDRSHEAIEYALTKNKNKNINYEINDIQNLNFKNRSFDSIVSLETIEHINESDCVNFFKKTTDWLSVGGCFIGSSPMLRYDENNQPYITNPYHINEMPKNKLISLINNIFKGFTIYLFHQKETIFLPLQNENTGFCIFIARKEII